MQGRTGLGTELIFYEISTNQLMVSPKGKMSRIEELVIERIRQRAEEGKAKYGVTMERTDLSTKEWLNHALEESLDLSVYLMKLIDEAKNI